ncbi:MYXO-CTERM sorting domain-containing protein [Nannocystis punicea]|uniref:MYXO-CTERM sorting domain-containing protein n=1 Tax=Nannocystis punicea TaxID=2995304 RepID=A0ABY7HIW0_9BACT|nr:MYXO-CTERM sorting domain-containing protein [Nannocystis poenicansa]WAS98884.1 MYXO-CTERM sorting domain-containing protein [Nannocystis poenicansa]
MLTFFAGLSLAVASLSLEDAAAAPLPRIVPGAPLSANTPWAVAPEDGPRSYLESLFGEGYDPRLVAPLRDGNLMYDGESLSRSVLEQQGLPLPALDHDPTAGILFLAMDGVTLRPQCNGFHPQTANAALNCSPLVAKETVFPKPPGGENTKAVVFQELQNYYEPFNLVITTNRPPDYLPYTMAVIGGTSGNAGQGNGVCGIANVACDGAKRNHVSLSFPDSCVGVTAEVAAQETAHNWGLEHTDVQQDLMYPFVAGGSSFRNECMDISHATGNGVTQCTYVHKLYCPEGQGEQQNSHTELLGVFGPREVDSVAPEILSVSPADGSVFNAGDSFLVTADITDDNNMVGVKWSWIEGVPPDFMDTGYSRCTNDVCNDKYSAWRPIDDPWDFVQITKPPAGTYSFKIEVMDAYGNADSETITVTVMPAEGTTTGEPATTGDETTGGDETTSEPAPTTSAGTSEGDDTGSVDPSAGSGLTGVTGASGLTGDTGGSGNDDGCDCRTDAGPRASWLLLLAGLLPLRRRSRRG